MSHYRSQYGDGKGWDNGPFLPYSERFVPGLPVEPVPAEVDAEDMPAFWQYAEGALVYQEGVRYKELGATSLVNSDIWYDVTGADPHWMNGEY